MKRRLTFSLTLSIVGFFLLADPFQRNLQPFNQLSLKQGIEVTFINGSEYKAQLDILGGYPKDVLTEVKNGQLTIRIKPTVRYKDIEVNVALTYISLNLFNLSSTGMVKGSNHLKNEALGINVISSGCLKLKALCYNFILDVSSSGFVDMSIKVNNLEAGVSSAGHVEPRGQVVDQVLDISNGAYYKGFKTISQRTLVNLSSGSWAQVHARKKLDPHACNGGSVEFQGSPLSLNKRSVSGGYLSQY